MRAPDVKASSTMQLRSAAVREGAGPPHLAAGYHGGVRLDWAMSGERITRRSIRPMPRRARAQKRLEASRRAPAYSPGFSGEAPMEASRSGRDRVAGTWALAALVALGVFVWAAIPVVLIQPFKAQTPFGV